MQSIINRLFLTVILPIPGCVKLGFFYLVPSMIYWDFQCFLQVKNSKHGMAIYAYTDHSLVISSAASWSWHGLELVITKLNNINLCVVYFPPKTSYATELQDPLRENIPKCLPPFSNYSFMRL